MDKVIKIILSILVALCAFLAGWFAHAWKNRKEVPKEVKKAISELNREHKKALKSIRDSYEEKLKKKEEIIKSLEQIIDRLLKLFETIPGNSSEKVISNLTTNKDKLLHLRTGAQK